MKWIQPDLAQLRAAMEKHPPPKLPGSVRCVSPSETVERLRGVLAEAGVSRVADITGLDVIGIPVVAVTRPNSRSLAVAQGKGPTLDAARASGMMEAIEMCCAERVDAPLRLAASWDLAAEGSVVDLTQLPRTVAFDRAEERALWRQALDLGHDEAVWVPLEVVTVDSTARLPGEGRLLSTSTGLASGNEVYEAIAHGLCELIERDAVTLWRQRSVSARAETLVDLDSVTDETCKELVGLYKEAGVDVVVWDATSDVSVPVFVALIVESHTDPGRLRLTSYGMGCHLDPSVALLRALTEAAQSRLTLIAGSRDDLTREDYLRFLSGPPEGFPNPGSALRAFNPVAMGVGPTAADAGLRQTLVVDLTPGGWPLSVVRVMVPGLEGPSSAAGYVLGPRAKAVRRL